MEITFIQTGGTIDKDYPMRAGSYAFEIGGPAVEKILKIVRPNFRFHIVSLLKKDSLDLSDSDRELIYQTSKSTQAKKIVITHGTDTMVRTAEKLSTIGGKTIVLTGAMLPDTFKKSDAMFNVGMAVGAVDYLKPGVYIAMSGRIYPWQRCKKSLKTVKFVYKTGQHSA